MYLASRGTGRRRLLWARPPRPCIPIRNALTGYDGRSGDASGGVVHPTWGDDEPPGAHRGGPGGGSRWRRRATSSRRPRAGRFGKDLNAYHVGRLVGPRVCGPRRGGRSRGAAWVMMREGFLRPAGSPSLVRTCSWPRAHGRDGRRHACHPGHGAHGRQAAHHDRGGGGPPRASPDDFSPADYFRPDQPPAA